MEYRCPLDMLDCVRACVRLVALSVEASLAKRYLRVVLFCRAMVLVRVLLLLMMIMAPST